MTRRLTLDANALRIAKVGYDADTATVEQMLFDSASQGLSVYLTGTCYVPPATGHVPQYMGEMFTTQASFAEVPFPSLGYIPLVVAQATYGGQVIGGGGWTQLPAYWQGNPNIRQDQWEAQGAGLNNASVMVAENRAGVLMNKLRFGNDRVQSSITCRYVIFRNRVV